MTNYTRVPKCIVFYMLVVAWCIGVLNKGIGVGPCFLALMKLNDVLKMGIPCPEEGHGCWVCALGTTVHLTQQSLKHATANQIGRLVGWGGGHSHDN